MQPNLTDTEGTLLRRLAEMGGRYTFRPDGENLVAVTVFEDQIVGLLVALEGKGLVRFDRDTTLLMGEPDRAAWFGALGVELTEAGRRAARKSLT